MFLRVLIGRYSGEIREFAPEAARAMLADGRAENPYLDTPGPPLILAPVQADVSAKRASRKGPHA